MTREAFKIHVFGIVTCIMEFHSRFHIDAKDLYNICVCVNLSLVKPEHLELVRTSEQTQTDETDNVNVCENSHKNINEGLHHFHLVPKIMSN